MDEPPAKRAKRTDGSGAWDRKENPDSRPTSSGRDTKPRTHHEDSRDGERRYRRDDDHRKRSRSRDTYERRRERDRSRERSHRDRDPGREKDRERAGRDRNVNGDGHRDRSRSRDRHRPSKGTETRSQPHNLCSRDTDYRSERSHRHSRSRSPERNGGSGPVRTRSPPRRSAHDRGRPRDHPKPAEQETTSKARSNVADGEKAASNGDKMTINEDEEEALLRKMMGFTSFKTTQNTKVPGNQIYGVRKEKKTEYRQYMNRVGGFNRPLSPSRT